MALADRIVYASAGGVVVSGQQVLVMVRPGRVGPDGRPEVRLPKGHIEPGEGRAEAALREVREESGLAHVKIVADLGHQVVEFDSQGKHVIRDEFCFLMICGRTAPPGPPEKQFTLQWLPWDEALAQLTFEAEREWVRRARKCWKRMSTVRRQGVSTARE